MAASQETTNDPLDGIRFLDYFIRKGVPFYDTLPDGWVINERATTAPSGYVWINNRMSIFSPEYRHALMKRTKKQTDLCHTTASEGACT